MLAMNCVIPRSGLGCAVAVLLASLPVGALGGGHAAGEVVPQTNRSFTTSATGRFVARGPDVFTCMAQTRWAEETTGNLERFLGVKFPIRRSEAIEIRLVSGREAAFLPSLVCREESGLFLRVLVVNTAVSPDPEVMDELLCRALMTGYIRERRRGVAGSRMPAIPQWLTMGVAQNLDAAVRGRNRDVVTEWRPESEVPTLADVFRWESIPEGWPRYRSVCGMVTQWLGTFGVSVSPYVRIMDRLADTGGVREEWLAETLTGLGTGAAMEQAWREWLQRQGNLIHSFGEVSSRLIGQVQAELPLAVSSGPDNAVPLWLTPREAIARRGEPGVSFAALQKAQRLRSVTLGKAEELVSVGEDFAVFYERLASGAWTVTLSRALGRAEKKLELLAELTRKREAYLDALEREVRDRSGEWRDPAPAREPVLEKGRFERYVDEAEMKFGDRPKDTSRD